MKIPIWAAQNKQRGRQFDMPALELRNVFEAQTLTNIICSCGGRDFGYPLSVSWYSAKKQHKIELWLNS